MSKLDCNFNELSLTIHTGPDLSLVTSAPLCDFRKCLDSSAFMCLHVVCFHVGDTWCIHICTITVTHSGHDGNWQTLMPCLMWAIIMPRSSSDFSSFKSDIFIVKAPIMVFYINNGLNDFGEQNKTKRRVIKGLSWTQTMLQILPVLLCFFWMCKEETCSLEELYPMAICCV